MHKNRHNAMPVHIKSSFIITSHCFHLFSPNHHYYDRIVTLQIFDNTQNLHKTHHFVVTHLLVVRLNDSFSSTFRIFFCYIFCLAYGLSKL